MWYKVYTQVSVTCTVRELHRMELTKQAVYFTPKSNQVYVNEHQLWIGDVIIATVCDFCYSEGWTDLGDFDPDDPMLNHEITISIDALYQGEMV